MVSVQAGYKVRILVVLMVVFALRATVAMAGANEDLIEAAKRGDLVAVKGFIVNGADTNAKDKNGGTALIFASGNGHIEIVQALLDKGADVNAKTNQGLTALRLASQEGHKEVVQLLLVPCNIYNFG